MALNRDERNFMKAVYIFLAFWGVVILSIILVIANSKATN